MNSLKPEQIYRQIDPDAWRRIFLVGDLHGCYDLLLAKLARRQFDDKHDLLVSVGDLIDRGAQSLECLQLLEQPWFCAVRGNHEQMAIDALSWHDAEMWLANGGGWFFRLDDAKRRRAAELIGLCDELPLVIDIHMATRHCVVAHADYPLNTYAFLKDIDPEQVVWSRRRINRNQRGIGAPIDGASHFFFGHTPLERVRHFYNQYYIDTGAVFGGSLTLIELTSLPF